MRRFTHLPNSSDRRSISASIVGNEASERGLSGGGITHSSDFESGNNNGWGLLPPQRGQGGEWSDIVDVSTLPPPPHVPTAYRSDVPADKETDAAMRELMSSHLPIDPA